MSWTKLLKEVAAGRKFNRGESGEWPISPLTNAEKDVLIAMLPTSDGGELTQSEVAKQLDIVERTVMDHITSVCDKFLIDAGKGRTKKLRSKIQSAFKSLSADNPWLDLLQKAEHTNDKIKFSFPEKMNEKKNNEDSSPYGNPESVGGSEWPQSLTQYQASSLSDLGLIYRQAVWEETIEIKKGKKFFINIYTKKQGHLILLENVLQSDGTSNVFCLCPSIFRTSNLVDADCIKVPESDRPFSDNACGEVELLAIIMEDSSEFFWLENAKSDSSYIVTKKDLNLILDNFILAKEILFTRFSVIR